MLLAISPAATAAAALASRFAVGFVFILAAVPKLVSPQEFERAVGNYRLLPPLLIGPLARWLPRIELLCGASLLVGFFVPIAGFAAATFLLSFSTAAGINLARGRSIDCGCGGGIARRIGWDLVIGDLILAGAACLASLINPDVLEPGFSRLMSESSSLGAHDALAILVAVGLAGFMRPLVSAFLRLRLTAKSVSATWGGQTE